jgi:hypothetical protein
MLRLLLQHQQQQQKTRATQLPDPAIRSKNCVIWQLLGIK